MANKENQEALNVLSNGLNVIWQGNEIIFPKETRDKYIEILQKAIDTLEQTDKALELACLILKDNIYPNNETAKQFFMRVAKECNSFNETDTFKEIRKELNK